MSTPQKTPQQVSSNTVDRLVVIFAITVAAVIIFATVGTLVFASIDVEWDAQPVITAIDAQISVIVGGLVGLLAGQASARVERQKQDRQDADTAVTAATAAAASAADAAVSAADAAAAAAAPPQERP